jgi:hypothetical protein
MEPKMGRPYLNEKLDDVGTALVTLSILFLIFGWFTVALRCFVRIRRKSFMLADKLMLIGVV